MTALITRVRVARFASYLSTQAVVQVVGFLGGIVLVHRMEQVQYGYYSLAISMIGLANVLLDLGLCTAVLAIGGRLVAEHKRLSGLLGEAFSLQRRLAMTGVVLLLPIFAAMLMWQGVAVVDVVVLSVLAICCGLFNARNQVVMSVVRLHGDLAAQQRVEVVINLGKLALIFSLALIYIDARIAVATNLLAAAAMSVYLQRYLADHFGPSPAPQHEHGDPLRRFVRQQAPNTLYYCVSGQIAFWLLSLHGHADRLAEVGALGRLAIIIALVGMVITTLVQPYFARATARHELVSGFVALNGFFAVLTAVTMAVAIVLPGACLWILGPRYGALTNEIVWLVLSASLMAWSGAVYSVGAARGWVVPIYLILPFGVGSMALSAWLLDVSTVVGSLQMNTVMAVVSTLLMAGFMVLKLSELARERGTNAPR